MQSNARYFESHFCLISSVRKINHLKDRGQKWLKISPILTILKIETTISILNTNQITLKIVLNDFSCDFTYNKHLKLKKPNKSSSSKIMHKMCIFIISRTKHATLHDLCNFLIFYRFLKFKSFL